MSEVGSGAQATRAASGALPLFWGDETAVTWAAAEAIAAAGLYGTMVDARPGTIVYVGSGIRSTPAKSMSCGLGAASARAAKAEVRMRESMVKESERAKKD